MKKLLLIVVATVLVLGVKAQSEFTFGPKVGMNVTNISNSDGDNKMSLNVGAFGQAKLSDLIGVQVELLYSRQGFRDKGFMGENSAKVQARVNYLNIPVLARFYVMDKFSVDFGPQLGFALNAKARIKDGDTKIKRKIDDLNTVDLSLAMGVSYEFDMGVMVSARYNLGLTNVFDKDTFGSTNKNRVFQLSVGYKLNL